jgi:glucose-1-phosphate thymidylyltransferase
LKPSACGELEITDVNLEYLKRGKLSVVPMDPEVEWMDAGNSDSLLDAANWIVSIKKETGKNIGCLEENAMQEGFISVDQAHRIGEKLKKTKYGEYLLKL